MVTILLEKNVITRCHCEQEEEEPSNESKPEPERGSRMHGKRTRDSAGGDYLVHVMTEGSIYPKDV